MVQYAAAHDQVEEAIGIGESFSVHDREMCPRLKAFSGKQTTSRLDRLGRNVYAMHFCARTRKFLRDLTKAAAVVECDGPSAIPGDSFRQMLATASNSGIE